MKIEMMPHPGFFDEQVDRAAHALRDHFQGGKLLKDWDQLSNSVKKKWWDAAIVALQASLLA